MKKLANEHTDTLLEFTNLQVEKIKNEDLCEMCNYLVEHIETYRLLVDALITQKEKAKIADNNWDHLL